MPKAFHRDPVVRFGFLDGLKFVPTFSTGQYPLGSWVGGEVLVGVEFGDGCILYSYYEFWGVD